MRRSIALLPCLLAAVATSAAASTIQITAAGCPDSVVIDLHIVDQGGAPDCYAFGVTRSAWSPCGAGVSLGCIPRQAGTSDHRFVDHNVQPNTGYVYEVVGYGIIPVPLCIAQSNIQSFRSAFDPTGWGFPIWAFVNCGPNPAPVAHGRVVSGPQLDPNAVLVRECDGECTPIAVMLRSPLIDPYVDTGTEVAIYGSFGYYGNYYGWLLGVSSVTEAPCVPLAVQHQDWTTVKMLYRDAR